MYALVNLDTLAIVDFEDNVDLSAQTKPPFKWLLITRAERPEVGASQVLLGPFYDVTPPDVRERWELRDKSQEELASDVDAKIARIGEETRVVLENHNQRLVTLEGNQSGGFLGFLKNLFGG